MVSLIDDISHVLLVNVLGVMAGVPVDQCKQSGKKPLEKLQTPPMHTPTKSPEYKKVKKEILAEVS